jgi:hypothetical protein
MEKIALMSYTKVPITEIRINSLGESNTELEITILYETGDKQEFPIIELANGETATIVFDNKHGSPTPDNITQVVSKNFRLIRVKDNE